MGADEREGREMTPANNKSAGYLPTPAAESFHHATPGRRLKAEFVARGWDYRRGVDELAARGVRITESTLSKIITGRAQPSAEVRRALSEAIGFQLWELGL